VVVITGGDGPVIDIALGSITPVASAGMQALANSSKTER
jgi:hypothetical protein